MGNNQEFKYIIYKTTNIVNNKIYIGVHKTSTPYEFDNYLGCGSKINIPSSYNKGETPFHKAILKYGTESFKRETWMYVEENLRVHQDMYLNIKINDIV